MRISTHSSPYGDSSAGTTFNIVRSAESVEISLAFGEAEAEARREVIPSNSVTAEFLLRVDFTAKAGENQDETDDDGTLRWMGPSELELPVAALGASGCLSKEREKSLPRNALLSVQLPRFVVRFSKSFSSSC